jgi:ParB/RepB/Spo0J family partition protein
VSDLDIFALPVHPAADKFPLMQGVEFDELVASIKTQGQREPIVVHRKHGCIIDGRNRVRACAKVGVGCEMVFFDGSDDEIIPYIIAKNLQRRHLTASQRAMIAAELATLQQGARTDIAPNDAMSDAQAARC